MSKKPAAVPTLDIKAAIADYTKARARKFAHDRSLTIGASEIGQCARKTWYEKKLGHKSYREDYQPAEGASIRGDIIEEHWTVPVLQAAAAQIGAKLIYAGSTQLSLEAPPLSCTPDGIMIGVPGSALLPYGIVESLTQDIMVEMKSFDPRKQIEGPLPTHRAQLTAQMGIVRKAKILNPMTGNFIVPKYGLLVYVNASFVDDVRVYPVAYIEDDYINLRIRAVEIMGAKKAEALRPEGIVAGGDECRYCPFSHICDGYAKNVPETKNNHISDKKLLTKLRSAVGTHDNMRRQIDQCKSKMDEAAAVIKETLALAGTKRADDHLIDGRHFKVSWNRTKGTKQFDRDGALERLVELGQDPDEFWLEGRPGERLTITLDKREGEEWKMKGEKEQTDG